MVTPARKQVDFLSKRFIAGGCSALAVIASFVLMVVPGPNYGIDFQGGTNIIAKFTEDVGDGSVREALSAAGYTDAAVQKFGSDGDFEYLVQMRAVTSLTAERQTLLSETLVAEFGEGTSVEFDETQGDRVYVQVPELVFDLAEGSGATDVNAVDSGFESIVARYSSQEPIINGRMVDVLNGAGFDRITATAYGNPSDRRFQVGVQTLQGVVSAAFTETLGDRFASIERVETVGPRVGQQLRADAVKAILLSLVCILIYIAFRFDLRYAPGAIVALFHDVMITLGVFVILQEEISLPILAALLTIVGYSLNDTIVNFDRIRENINLGDGRESMLDLVNRSLNECLSRTILTSVTTLIAVIVIYFVGGGLIQSFALAMIIGVIVGTYSSIFVASPIMVLTANYFAQRDRSRAAEIAAARSSVG
ncbi:MAG: preprotein translocase subunit SecF [Bradymonadia bacterium]|jgi:preprotein translocase subunit SecF